MDLLDNLFDLVSNGSILLALITNLNTYINNKDYGVSSWLSPIKIILIMIPVPIKMKKFFKDSYIKVLFCKNEFLNVVFDFSWIVITSFLVEIEARYNKTILIDYTGIGLLILGCLSSRNITIFSKSLNLMIFLSINLSILSANLGDTPALLSGLSRVNKGDECISLNYYCHDILIYEIGNVTCYNLLCQDDNIASCENISTNSCNLKFKIIYIIPMLLTILNGISLIIWSKMEDNTNIYFAENIILNSNEETLLSTEEY